MIHRIGVPNLITLGRMALSPLVLIPFIRCEWGHLPGVAGSIAALALALAIDLSDKADGVVARRYGLVSDTGKLLDPFADSIARFTVFLCFLWAGLAPLWMIAIIFYRDMIVACIRSLAAARSVVIAARWSGKAKATVQAIVSNGILALVVLHALGVLGDGVVRPAAWWGMLVVTGVTAWSAVDYIAGGLKVLSAPAEDAVGSRRP